MLRACQILLLLAVPIFTLQDQNTARWSRSPNEDHFVLDGCYEVRRCQPTAPPPEPTTSLPVPTTSLPVPTTSPALGTEGNPASSCKAILLDSSMSAKSGAYYIKTGTSVTKVYCYMENIPGCGGGGWTTIMKTDGSKTTFNRSSELWENKISYNTECGQSGPDENETKLPTYWTLPFHRLCLGMKNGSQAQPRWIQLYYKASSLYSLIADGQYRSVWLGRSQWKSLISGSSLQQNCDREGFNTPGNGRIRLRIGIISNNEYDCDTSDSHLGFGLEGGWCPNVSTGNCARWYGDNGDVTISTHGYILAQ